MSQNIVINLQFPSAHSLRMARLEKLRIEQGKNLYHIVREEQELEKEASAYDTHARARTRTRLQRMRARTHCKIDENNLGMWQRLRMLAAIQPGKMAHLNRLFEQERMDATERIMRVAAENEMVLLQEMALVAADDETHLGDQ